MSRNDGKRDREEVESKMSSMKQHHEHRRESVDRPACDERRNPFGDLRPHRSLRPLNPVHFMLQQRKQLLTP